MGDKLIKVTDYIHHNIDFLPTSSDCLILFQSTNDHDRYQLNQIIYLFDILNSTI